MAFSNKSVEEISKYFSKSLFFNDCENHSGCPTGRLGASRTSSSGNGFATIWGQKNETGMNLTMRPTREERISLEVIALSANRP
jgi:hypothetical protein